MGVEHFAFSPEDQVKYSGRPEVPNSVATPVLVGGGHEILRGKLYLGPINCVDESACQSLRQASITGIVNCTEDSPCYHESNIEYCRVSVRDEDFADIGIYLESATNFIHRHVEMQQGAVVVHCRQGVSRSASVVIAYLMRFQGMSLEKAYVLAKERRPLVNPNPGFWSQLKEFEKRVGQEASAGGSETFDTEWAKQSCATFASNPLAAGTLHQQLSDIAPNVMTTLLTSALDHVCGRGFKQSDVRWFNALTEALPSESTAIALDLLDRSSSFMMDWGSDVSDNELAQLTKPLLALRKLRSSGAEICNA
jgi:hypothetical protein